MWGDVVRAGRVGGRRKGDGGWRWGADERDMVWWFGCGGGGGGRV